MRRSRALLIAMIFGAAVAMPTVASSGPSVSVDVGLFYNDLAPYGSWVQTNSYGYGWIPYGVSAGWRPYTAGHWAYTDDFGLLWVSSEPFGWATYHYGRWYPDPVYGWIWIPGYEWGPSWCSFRSGGGYVGWAPLPPQAGWQVGVGFQAGPLAFDALIGPSYYNFVPQQRFLDYSVPRYFVPHSQNTTIINVTKNITNYNVDSGRVVNRTFRADQLEKTVGHAVKRIRPVEESSVQNVRHARVRSDEVAVFRPRVHEASSVTPPRGKPLARRGNSSQPTEVRERSDRDSAGPAVQQRTNQANEANARRELEERRTDADKREGQDGAEAQ